MSLWATWVKESLASNISLHHFISCCTPTDHFWSLKLYASHRGICLTVWSKNAVYEWQQKISTHFSSLWVSPRPHGVNRPHREPVNILARHLKHICCQIPLSTTGQINNFSQGSLTTKGNPWVDGRKKNVVKSSTPHLTRSSCQWRWRGFQASRTAIAWVG